MLAKYLRTIQPSCKLAECFLGSFTIMGKPSTQSYQIKLLDYLRLVHPVFHIFQLKPSTPSSIPDQTNPPPPPIKVDRNLKYKILQILDSKWDHCRLSPLLYYIQWVGYKGTDEENSWISALELIHASDLLQDFHSQNLGKPGPTNTPNNFTKSPEGEEDP